MSTRRTDTTTARVPTLRLMGLMIRRAPWRYAANVLLWATIWLIPIIPALITREFFNRLETDPGLNVTTLIVMILMYGLARLTVMAVGMWNDVLFGFRVTSLLRRNMLEQIYEQPGAQAVHDSPGEMISRFREDVDAIEEAVSWTVDLAGTALFATVAATVMLSIDARMTVLVFAPLVVIVIVAERLGGRIRRYRTAAREATGRITGMLGETFGSVQSIKVAGAEASTMAEFRRLNDARRKVMVRDQVLTATLESVFWNLVNVGVGLVLILSASSMSSGDLGLGDFALFVFFLDYVTDAGFFIGLFVARVKQASVAFERMAGIMGGVPATELAHPRDLQLTGELRRPEMDAPVDDGRFRSLEVRGLAFHYPGSDVGIEDIDLDVPAGSFVVVTGRVGAGKTTLLRALLGLVAPDGGEVRWNGRLVAEPDDFFVPPRSAYVPQVPTLFSMTLRDNLLMGRNDDDNDLLDAVRSAAFERDLEAMPNGLDTMVGPLGMRLSGGQVQRTATARMFVRRPDLLVIDDLSSALDVETEKTLWDRLIREHAGTTALVVSHRRPALLRADQIVLLDGGRVVARGTYDELLESVPEFGALWETEPVG
jgi:ATP-binding cassette subfamily B protein